MKKYICIFVIAAICASIMFIVSCGNNKEGNDMNEIFFDKYVTDDSKKLENILTREYNVNELKSFFEGNSSNENMGFGLTTSELLFGEVNRQYPIEIIRSRGYSVYRVSQGGYFYVFWIKPVATNISQTDEEPLVYFSAYLSSSTVPIIFDSLKVGISTAEDVKMIDPSFELMFLRSNGIFSYSFLNDEDLLEIEYISEDEVDGYDDLIVKEIKVIPRKDAPSRYSSILSMDLPG